MAQEERVVDISSDPKLLRLAEEVHKSGRPRVLRVDGRDIAEIVPLRQARHRRIGRPKTEEDMAAFRSSFGSWKDEDTDKLIRDIYESRRISTRPPVDL